MERTGFNDRTQEIVQSTVDSHNRDIEVNLKSPRPDCLRTFVIDATKDSCLLIQGQTPQQLKGTDRSSHLIMLVLAPATQPTNEIGPAMQYNYHCYRATSFR